MNADFSTESSQGYPSDDHEQHDHSFDERFESLPVLWQDFLTDGAVKFVDQRAELVAYPDYLLALSKHYAIQMTERFHLHGDQQRAIVAEFEGAVYSIMLEKHGNAWTKST